MTQEKARKKLVDAICASLRAAANGLPEKETDRRIDRMLDAIDAFAAACRKGP